MIMVTPYIMSNAEMNAQAAKDSSTRAIPNRLKRLGRLSEKSISRTLSLFLSITFLLI
jgi:hypothetical protein